MSNINQSQAAVNGTEGNNYVDMHVVGLGYLSRVREVAVRKGKPFTSASIRGFHGEKGADDGMTFLSFDVKAASAQALEVLKQFEAESNDKDQKVMVKFRIGDPYINTYTISQGDRAGQTAMQIKGRLLTVTHVWVKAKGAAGYALKYEKPVTTATQADTPAQAPQADGTNG